jgi:hypothetical protein
MFCSVIESELARSWHSIHYFARGKCAKGAYVPYFLGCFVVQPSDPVPFYNTCPPLAFCNRNYIDEFAALEHVGRLNLFAHQLGCEVKSLLCVSPRYRSFISCGVILLSANCVGMRNKQYADSFEI